ncbi:hypothetical protein QFZ77_002208 [Paenibacillus sp. V4I3]|uniref:hypothetical protein n=1 Tax=Paenibacillus sp. V4I3 TaxID=3042305 RepID=UPI00278ABEB5|nr:hypothetical protein [Paenibacillus sp. V4I3]MDQ0873549.1 hypothetical protein [Paenibacillus sp. V4I3]
MDLQVHPNWVSERKLQIHWNKSNEMVSQAVKIVIPLDLSNQMAGLSSGDGLLLDLIQ